MAEEVGLMSGDEEETQINDGEDSFQTCHALTTADCCSTEPLQGSSNEEKERSIVPARLSVLSSKAIACEKTLIGHQFIAHNKVQNIAPGFTEYHSTDANMPLAASSYPVAICKLMPVDTSSPCSESLLWNSNQKSEESQLSGAAKESALPQNLASLLVSGFSCCRTWNSKTELTLEGPLKVWTPCSLSQTIWMKTMKVTETIEKQKQEEKERYQLQLAMYRRLLLLRSIRSLHKQLEQQQARLQECYGMVINTKKEVLKHIRSTSPSPSP
ncbi:PREDICTED: uncharacterized protein LOC109299344 [Gavialis gangeticus]|uniref:uncharacterized protein LOC109299344 n=1 Tax=Gavialis gangeticus TaxID=94835 RepID=UPI00092E351D|nr:PREDICTED: uncharacterized protein LOC109299344 [Gavialis gangeticus]